MHGYIQLRLSLTWEIDFGSQKHSDSNVEGGNLTQLLVLNFT